MKTVGSALWTLTFCAPMMLTGCGQPQSTPEALPASSSSMLATPIPPLPSGMRLNGWLSPAIQKHGATNGPVVYVADQANSKILVYPEAGGPLMGEITDGIDSPYGLSVDKDGTLYVANEGNSTVTAYPRGSTSPSMTWSQDLQQPLYPIVRGGNLFVGNRVGGKVVEYRSGSAYVYQVLQTPGGEADGMDFDSHGNLYVAYRGGSKHTSIVEFPPGTTHGEILRMKLRQPQGLIVDNDGNIIVVETGRVDRIDLFKPGSKRPSQLIYAREYGTLVQIAITANESELFASTIEGSVLTIAYPFPASGTLSQLLKADDDTQGIALSNGQSF